MRRFLFLALTFVFTGGVIDVIAQTCDVTWRRADNPRVISGAVTIPAGQTVCVESGVQVEFAADGELILNGRLTGAGTADQRITFTAQNTSPNRIFDFGGTLDMSFADFGALVFLNRGTFYCRDCRFKKFGMIGDGSGLFPSFLSLERAEFDSNEPKKNDNASIYLKGATVVLRDITFRNSAWTDIQNSYLFVDNITSQDSAYEGLKFASNFIQDIYLNNLTVTNSTGAGLFLSEGDFEIGDNVVIQNAEYPVEGNAGILPGSRLPGSGNRNNYVNIINYIGGRTFSPLAIPYVTSNISGQEILPGTVIKMRPDSFFIASSTTRILGLPGNPVTIEPFDPARKWYSGQLTAPGNRMEYVILDGSQAGIVDADTTSQIFYIDNSIIRNHDRAIEGQSFSFAFLQGNLFTNNGLAIEADSSIRASGKKNPNLFENNAVAMTAEFNTNPDARYNWWNSPTGPTAPNNPGGTGEIIDGIAQIDFFRTVRPDTSDHPPVVRILRQPFRAARGYYQNVFEAGNKVILNWKASDDRKIVKQKILFSRKTNGRDNLSLIADNLPADQNSFELTVPNVGFQTSTGSDTFIRVAAFDDKGQEGWDEWQVRVPSEEETGNLQITSNVAGQTFYGGEPLSVTWMVTSPFVTNSYTAYLFLDNDQKTVFLGNGNGGGTFAVPRLPRVSTDSARLAVSVSSTTNRQKWFYSQPFSIRPDPRFADAAPQVSLTSPSDNQQFPAGGIVPLSWTASDDNPLRRFDILASLNGGRTWQPVAENLPGDTRSYNWKLPPNSSANNNVQIRVVAVDLRFQNSSATRSIILNGQNSAPTVQITLPANNGSVVSDKVAFLTANAEDSDGRIERVEFYRTTNYTGTPVREIIASDANPPFQVAWLPFESGTQTLIARAYDDKNAVTESAPVTVNVTPNTPAPLPITIPELDAPEDGQNFPAGSDITLRAAPGVGGRTIVRMEFYNGTELIGSDTTAPYEIVWNDVPEGIYTIFAKKIANNGADAASKPADIAVGNSQIARRTMFDFDGDGKADPSVFRPSEGIWYLLQSSQGFSGSNWGTSTDKIMPADYDGDGKTDIAVFRKSENSTWYILNSQSNTVSVAQWGASNLEQAILYDTPVPADYDGDGKADLAVWRLTDNFGEPAKFLILQSSDNSTRFQQWGNHEDRPVPADYDGDGKTDLAVYRGGTWYILKSSDNSWYAVQFGLDQDKTVPADYDGDGKADIAVYRDGVWYIEQSRDGLLIFQFGLADDKPTPADYDGDGKADIAVFRDGIWYLQQSLNGILIFQFGLSDDFPIPSAYISQ